MKTRIDRRTFLGAGAAAAGLAWSQKGASAVAADRRPRGRIGLIGCGGRGSGLLRTLLRIDGVEIPAVCDVRSEATTRAQDAVEQSRGRRPEAYVDGPEDYKRLVAREDIDAIIVATPWSWHTPMAVEGMKARKYVGVEVPAALTLQECWTLVETSEETGSPCMMLENWSFRRDNLAVLNMIRKGLLGEMVHCHCAHSHDCIDHWFFDGEGNMRWGGEFLVRRNADQYPTHSLGPVLSWLDVNCGDAFQHVTSTATRSLGIRRYFERKFGPDHPNAKREYAQGDVVTTVIKTHRGKTIVVNYDMQLPRPYDNRWMVQGTLGIYDEARSAVYLEGRSPEYHEWEPFAPYQNEFDHSWWTSLPAKEAEAGHGGTDTLELSLFVEAVKARRPLPIDVIDSVTMSSIIPLSEASIAAGSAPVECPDFTRGKWKTRLPYFAIDPEAK